MLRSWVIMATENSYDCVRRGTVSKVLCVERSLNGYLGVLLPFCYPREQLRLSPLEGRRGPPSVGMTVAGIRAGTTSPLSHCGMVLEDRAISKRDEFANSQPGQAQDRMMLPLPL